MQISLDPGEIGPIGGPPPTKSGRLTWILYYYVLFELSYGNFHAEIKEKSVPMRFQCLRAQNGVQTNALGLKIFSKFIWKIFIFYFFSFC